MNESVAQQLTATAARLAAPPAAGEGFDLVIISAATPAQARYWQHRLATTRDYLLSPSAGVLAVAEDWPGGAGNALGTLYALQQADDHLQSVGGDGLAARLAKGAAIAVYHTAGKGQRLAPLPASETGNKPGVKLPGLLGAADPPVMLTILEAVLRQTSLYAASRAGRVSVFWGDQVFIPAVLPVARREWPAGVLMAKLQPLPGPAEWAARDLSRYGLALVRSDGAAQQLEKLSYEALQGLLATGVVEATGGIGVSLGSFHISGDLALALLKEFEPELTARTGKLDTDPHLWMPLSLPSATYCDLMGSKGMSPAAAAAHCDRMHRFYRGLGWSGPSQLGVEDVGVASWWWDYGQLASYYANHLKLCAVGPEADAMRAFFGLAAQPQQPLPAAVDVDAASIVQGCHLGRGRIRRSVLIGVTATELVAEDAVILASAAPRMEVRGSLLYQAVGDHFALPRGTACAGLFRPDTPPVTITTALTADGRADWDHRLPGNPASYAELDAYCRGADPLVAEDCAAAARAQAREPLLPGAGPG